MLYEKLKKHNFENIYPMHMPGHKRNPLFMPEDFNCDIDITEIPGFDDLRDPRGVLSETAELAAGLYHCREAFLLVNGSTVGILAAVGAHCKHGDKILAADNCHWSTPNAAELFGLEVQYITLKIDEQTGVPCSVTPDSVEIALKNDSDIKMVVIISPSYEGVVSDISTIAKVVHDAGAVLLVDCAHGAHLGFSDHFPENPAVLGADIVVVSLHKTLPALTQCSLLFMCNGRADTANTKRLLNILQTSSPSYILMSSIDHCLRLLESDRIRLFDDYYQKLIAFSNKIKGLKNLSVLYHNYALSPERFYDFDPGKIVIVKKKAAFDDSLLNTSIGINNIAEILRNEYKIEPERICDDYIIAMTSICDTQEGFDRLADALNAVDDRLFNCV